MTVIELPMPPTDNNLFGHAGNRRYRTQAYENWILEAGHHLNRQCRAKYESVSLLIEVATPKTKKTYDLSKRRNAVEDLLVKHRIIPDDCYPYVMHITQTWAPDIDGIRVTVRPWKD